MREDQLADASLLRHLTALPGMQMNRARPIGWERTIQNGKIDLSTETHETGAIL